MKYVFIINSYTIKNRRDVCNKIKLYCDKTNLKYIIEFNDKNKTTEEILSKYKDDSYIIIAVGGDGMINRVLNSIINTNNILGFIPSGTGNDFYKSVKKQCNNEINHCDLIKINNKYFINVACFGIDADIANDSTVIKLKILKKYKYIINLIKHFYKYKSREFVVEINNKKIKGKYVTIALCNGMYYGSGFNIGPKSKINDGLIDVYLVNNLNKLKMINLILKMKKGKHEKHKAVEKYNLKSLSIKSRDKIKCNIDGEVLESNKFDIKVLDKKIKLYYNQEMIDSILK